MPGEIFTATLTSARIVAPEVREIVLQPLLPEPFAYRPGQWISLRLPVGDRPPLIRAYSMATPPRRDGSLVLTFDRVAGGLGSGYLWDVAVGETLEFSGPLGNFALPEAGDVLMIAHYTGIVPFRAMILAAPGDDAFAASGRRIRLIYTADRAEDQAYSDELTENSRANSWFEYFPITAGEGDPAPAVIAFLRANGHAWMPFTPLVCGIRDFTFPVRAALMEAFGFGRREVKVENYNGPSAA